ncbi:MAG: hypothetical protein COA91_10190 [Robiginitomaculum sp.]|nr:MAG: hypothetical protein COA91_10190 [Robiginitomaculum sp.]
MSIRIIHLRKLLRAFNEPNNRKVTLLRGDIRMELKKQTRPSSKGGDFHGPFWSDAKNHASGKIDLSIATLNRIASNEARGRLYPELTDGFLEWWHNKRRTRNEPITAFPYSVKKRYVINQLDAIVKVENLLSVMIGDPKNGEQEKRLVYPYFSEEPILDEKTARLGLWLLSEALPEYDPKDLRILDVIRARAFSLSESPLTGTEEYEFVKKYAKLIDEWEQLRQEYG